MSPQTSLLCAWNRYGHGHLLSRAAEGPAASLTRPLTLRLMTGLENSCEDTITDGARGPREPPSRNGIGEGSWPGVTDRPPCQRRRAGSLDLFGRRWAGI